MEFLGYETFQSIVKVNMPFDTGNMYANGVVFFDTPYYYRAAYDINRVPYIVFNEEGTVYSQKNKGFISQKTTGAVNRAVQSIILGLPYNEKEISEEYSKRNNEILISQGVMTRAR